MNNTTRFERPFPQLKIETAKVIERLRYGKVGDSVTDSELATITGQNDRNKLLQTVNRAILAVARDHRRTWVRLRSQNKIQCANVGQIIDMNGSVLRSIRRRTKRALVKCNNADLASASNADRSALLMSAAQLGAIGQAAMPKALASGGKVNDTMDMRAMLASLAGHN